MSENERQLIESARNGCVASFEELIEPHQNRIYNLMFKTCRNEFEASQLTQEVFVRVFRSLALKKSDGCFIINIYRTAGEVSRQAVCKSKMIS
jgi:RNA polymerase sigma-70 factor (ECF subfamily)